MTQLLISVKNVAEAKLALACGADIIDLKDPNVGALGALDMVLSAEIVRAIQLEGAVGNAAQVSATVGEQHVDLNSLISDVQARDNIEIDMIKIEVSSQFYAENFVSSMLALSEKGIKLVAVFFADEAVDLNLLPILQRAGFFGAMLDTRAKQKNLLDAQTESALQLFTQQCNKCQLQSGLAGSLKPQHIDRLINFNPTYIGFRGGVCDNSNRNADLNRAKILEVTSMLQKDNRINKKAQRILALALHS